MLIATKRGIDFYYGPCGGDSGGPLYRKDKNKNLILTGVLSWAPSCGPFKVPHIWQKVKILLQNTVKCKLSEQKIFQVSHYTKWIHCVIAEANKHLPTATVLQNCNQELDTQKDLWDWSTYYNKKKYCWGFMKYIHFAGCTFCSVVLHTVLARW